MHTPPLTRRAFVRLSSSAALIAVAGCGGGSGGRDGPAAQPAPAGASVACALRALEREPGEVRAVAERFLAQSGSSADGARKELIDALDRSALDRHATSTEEVAAALHDAIDADWRSGASVLVDGWIVSLTEAQLTASALATDPASC